MKRALLFIAATLAFASPAAAFAAVPTVTINSDADGIIPATGDVTVKAYATFSEAVSGFNLGDIQITNGTASLLIQQSLKFYSFLVTVQGSGAVTVTATVPADTVQSVSTAENNTSGTDSWNYDSSLTTFTTVSGRSWYDANHDGVRTSSGSCSAAGDNCSPATETDLEGTAITATPVLDAAGGADPDRAALSTTTNSGGGYSFLFGSTVDMGRWRISETLPSGWTQTLPTTTDTFYDVTVNDTNGASDSVTRENYAGAINYNFGSYDPSLVIAATPLATPTTTPDISAGPFTSVQNVTLGTASSSATTTKIYYSFAPDADPSCSPLSGTLFSSAISIASSSTLKAIACSQASTSTVASFSFVINIPATPLATPTASPVPATYTNAQSVTLDTASSSATTTTLYYTENGTDPACPGTGTLFSSALSIASSTILKAIACSEASTSTVASFSYTINIPAPAPAPSGGGGGGNGPISDNVPVNAPPPSSGGGGNEGGGTAVIPTPPAEQGAVLGASTESGGGGGGGSGTGESSGSGSSLQNAQSGVEGAATEATTSTSTSPEAQAAAAGFAAENLPPWLWKLILALFAAGLVWLAYWWWNSKNA